MKSINSILLTILVISIGALSAQAQTQNEIREIYVKGCVNVLIKGSRNDDYYKVNGEAKVNFKDGILYAESKGKGNATIEIHQTKLPEYVSSNNGALTISDFIDRNIYYRPSEIVYTNLKIDKKGAGDILLNNIHTKVHISINATNMATDATNGLNLRIENISLGAIGSVELNCNNFDVVKMENVILSLVKSNITDCAAFNMKNITSSEFVFNNKSRKSVVTMKNIVASSKFNLNDVVGRKSTNRYRIDQINASLVDIQYQSMGELYVDNITASNARLGITNCIQCLFKNIHTNSLDLGCRNSCVDVNSITARNVLFDFDEGTKFNLQSHISATNMKLKLRDKVSSALFSDVSVTNAEMDVNGSFLQILRGYVLAAKINTTGKVEIEARNLTINKADITMDGNALLKLNIYKVQGIKNKGNGVLKNYNKNVVGGIDWTLMK